MIFLLLGAVPIFIFGLIVGISVTIPCIVIFLSFANGIPLTTPIQIGVCIYFQIKKSWHKLTRKSFKITDATAPNALNIEKLKAIPYVRVLPMTTPSKDAQFWIDLLFKEKRVFAAAIKEKYNPSRVYELRKHVSAGEPIFTLMKDHLCKVIIENVKNIPIHWIQYEGSSIDNGLILAIHGGGLSIVHTLICIFSITHLHMYSIRRRHAINALCSLHRSIQINRLRLCIYRLSVMSGNSHSANYNY